MYQDSIYLPKMLDAAEKRSDEKDLESNLIEADMRDFDLGEKFQLIFVAGNSFQHLDDVNDVKATLRSVKKHNGTGHQIHR